MSIMSFFKSFVGFRFSILLGLGMAIWLFMTQSEQQPLAAFLTSAHIYLIALFTILGLRLLIWVIIEKGSFYNITETIRNIIIDYITCIAALLSMSACLFLVQTFILS